MGRRPTRWRRRLKGWILRHGGRRRAVLALAALSVGDVLLPALPTQMSVLALGSLQPHRWIAIALAFAFAAASGVVLMASLLSWVEAFAGTIARASLGVDWRSAAARVRAFGPWAVLLASLLPVPPRTLIGAALLANTPVSVVALAVGMGKLIWFATFLGALRAAPGWLPRSRWSQPVVGRAQRWARASRRLAAMRAHAHDATG